MNEKKAICGDADWGAIVSCEALPERGESDWPWDKGTGVPNSNPMEARFAFKVTYANGSETHLSGNGTYLAAGFGFSGPDEDYRVRYGTRPLIARCVQCMADCAFIPFGPVQLPSEEEADAILDKLNVPKDLSVPDDTVYATVHDAWMHDLMADGRVIRPTGGTAYTAWLYNEDVARRTELMAKGPLVELCDGTVKRYDDLTEGEKFLIADPSESKINAAWLPQEEPDAS